jgi:hypothetical protein
MAHVVAVTLVRLSRFGVPAIAVFGPVGFADFLLMALMFGLAKTLAK